MWLLDVAGAKAGVNQHEVRGTLNQQTMANERTESGAACAVEKTTAKGTAGYAIQMMERVI